MITSLLRRRGMALGCWLLWIAAWAAQPAQGQGFRIQDLIRTNGAVVVHHPSDINRHCLLLRGNRVEQAFLPKDAALGLAGIGFLRDRLPPAA